ncbi:VanZ family protein [Pseudobowmanella zhangzhouensis]|uniref:VanZ family protein n=1 Tax=Pseudobowmanella zhangzhouensis TaxID=1537679 RepID=UPI00360D6C50
MPEHRSPVSLIRHPLALLILVLLLFAALYSLLAPAEAVPFKFSADWMNHSLLFCGLTLLVKLAFSIAMRWQWVIMLVLAAVLEWIQQWAPGRSASWQDFGFNLLGIGIGMAIVALTFLSKLEHRD